MLNVETAIIGAGPYGLSIAAHLAARGREFMIVGKPMESWRSFMPRDMILKSEPMASSLWDPALDYTLETYSRSALLPYEPCGGPLSLRQFLAYADWFQRCAVPEIRDCHVSGLRRGENGSFDLDLADGTAARARRVVIATGHAPFQRKPEVLARLPADLFSHTHHVTEPAAFRGRDVTIVGLGQSALETAALLAEAGASVRVIGRSRDVAWNDPPRPARSWLDRLREPAAGLGAGWRSYLFSEFAWAFRHLPADRRLTIVRNGWGPSGAWWLKDRVLGKIPLMTGARIEAAAEEGGKARLSVRGADGLREIVTDHVVAGTGFEVDFDRLSWIDPALRDAVVLRDKSPVLAADFQTSVPGLYATGMMGALTFGPSQRFMYGAKFAARTIAGSLGRSRAIAPDPGFSPARPAVAGQG